MRSIFILPTAALAVAANAQVSIGNGVVRSGNTVIDANGVHTGSTTVDSHGVRTRGGTITISSNGSHRTVSCEGGTLAVQGNDNVLDVSGCRGVEVNGNGNVVNARFAAAGRLGVMGNKNLVAWSAPQDVRVGVSNLGSGNQVSRH